MNPGGWLALLACVATACSGDALPAEVSEAPRPEHDTPPDASPPAPRIEERGGLVIEVLREGSGDRVRSGDWITVHYTGRLADGETPFGDTRGSGVPYSTRLARGHVIRGWERGLEGLAVGSKVVLHIPSALAYGDEGVEQVGIPPGADLIYDIEILNTAERPAGR